MGQEEDCNVKPYNEFTLDDTVRYCEEHTWAKIEDYHITVGISDFAQEQVGEIIYVELPEPDATYSLNEVFGFVESIKTVLDLYMPVSGKVIAVNDFLAGAPELVNNDPYEGRWLIKVLPNEPSEFDMLLSPQDYLKILKPNAFAK
jgi:glycine cleavage system H protein